MKIHNYLKQTITHTLVEVVLLLEIVNQSIKIIQYRIIILNRHLVNGINLVHLDHERLVNQNQIVLVKQIVVEVVIIDIEAIDIIIMVNVIDDVV